MSTDFDVLEPLTLAEAKKGLKKLGWTSHKNAEGHTSMTDGSGHVWPSEFEHGGEKHLSFTRFGVGSNWDTYEGLKEDLASLGYTCVDEHDDEYWELPWNLCDESECDGDVTEAGIVQASAK